MALGKFIVSNFQALLLFNQPYSPSALCSANPEHSETITNGTSSPDKTWHQEDILGQSICPKPNNQNAFIDMILSDLFNLINVLEI